MIFTFIVGPVRVHREALAETIGLTDRARAVGTASLHENVVRRVQELGPDVVLLDMTAAASLATARTILEALPEVKVVGLSVSEEEAEVIAAAEAGIAAFLPPESSVQDLLTAIEGVLRGEVYCSPAVAATLLRRVKALSTHKREETEVRLTLRELEIIELIDEGLSNKEIAQRLSIEVATVKNHVHNILEKLGVSRRGEAAAQVRRLGLVRMALKD